MNRKSNFGCQGDQIGLFLRGECYLAKTSVARAFCRFVAENVTVNANNFRQGKLKKTLVFCLLKWHFTNAQVSSRLVVPLLWKSFELLMDWVKIGPYVVTLCYWLWKKYASKQPMLGSIPCRLFLEKPLLSLYLHTTKFGALLLFLPRGTTYNNTTIQ